MPNSIVTSNGCLLPRSAPYFGALRETGMAALRDGTARRRFAEDGYLLLRDAIPREAALDLRETYFCLFDPRLLKNGDARDGAFSGRLPEGLPQHGTKGHPAHTFVRTERFRAFRQSPVFRDMAEAILGGPVKLVRRTPLRHFIRGSNRASRAHLDYTYLDCPADSCVTIWVPLGDCPLEAGGLLYLERSHEDPAMESRLKGFAPTDRPEDRRPITHDLKWLADATGRRWLGADFRAGDVVLHSPAIVHASTDPEIDLMRVSADIRFVRADVPDDPRWLDDWAADDGY